VVDKILRLFEGIGIELEYMIVDAASLDVRPRADWLLGQEGGELTGEVDRGAMAWNNELALHVIEFKTNGPVASLHGVAEKFQGEIERANALLQQEDLQLLPTAMHPWMDPDKEVRLWPHDMNEVYAAFDQVFNCRGHGWGNLQSMHINLPFADDSEFGRLHAAIRAVLPLLPGLAASSPIYSGHKSEMLDSRLEFYRTNCLRVPSVTGLMIPEPVFTIREYQDHLLAGIYRDLSRYDSDGLLQHEWVNARGAIARFTRMAIEIRLLDIQECPMADLAIAEVVVELVRALTEERWESIDRLRACDTAYLARLLRHHMRDADHTPMGDRHFLQLFGFRRSSETTSAELWAWIVERLVGWGRLSPNTEKVLEYIFSRGCLARRVLASIGEGGPARMLETYRDLGRCLAEGRLY
jgi:carboxylate-amine ligase